MIALTGLDSGFADSPSGIINLDISKTRAFINDRRSRGQIELVTCDQICALTNSAEIVRANSAAISMLSISGLEPSKQMATILCEALQRPFAEGLVALCEGERSFSIEGTLKTADGTQFPAVLSGWTQIDQQDPNDVWILVTKVAGLNDGLDEKSALLGDLAHIARISLLGEMTASISHEVNQPLSSIVTSAEAGLRWLNHQEPNLAEVRALLERIVSSGQRAGSIVAALKGMARNTKPEQKAASISEVINEASIILKADLMRRQVGLQVDISSNLPAVCIDRTQILQVLVNLATNAAQAMADGQAWNRTLLIRARRNSDRNVVVQVEDSGPGVDPGVRDRLFESFYTTKTSGMGMGLAICRSIIEAHGSSIELESSLYLGARFSFILKAV